VPGIFFVGEAGQGGGEREGVWSWLGFLGDFCTADGFMGDGWGRGARGRAEVENWTRLVGREGVGRQSSWSSESPFSVVERVTRFAGRCLEGVGAVLRLVPIVV